MAALSPYMAADRQPCHLKQQQRHHKEQPCHHKQQRCQQRGAQTCEFNGISHSVWYLHVHTVSLPACAEKTSISARDRLAGGKEE
eukprot:2436497-Rhodomonas_salina.1